MEDLYEMSRIFYSFFDLRDNMCNIKMEKNIITIDDGYLFECPHCSAPINVHRKELNCRIFRHGQMKNTYDVYVVKTGVTHKAVIIKGGNIGESISFTNPVTGENGEGIIKYINRGGQIPPHSSKTRCDQLLSDGLIWGCGKPFQISENIEYVIKCEYI